MSNETKWTPGPWKIAELQGDNIRTQKIRLIRPVDDRNSEYGAVAYVFGDESTINRSNARLIAAAPELYEEDEQRAKLLGHVYAMLLQENYQDAIDLIYESEVIGYSSGAPVAVSPALSKARGES